MAWKKCIVINWHWKSLSEGQPGPQRKKLWQWHKLVGGGQTTCIPVWHWGCEAGGQARKLNIGAHTTQKTKNLCRLAKSEETALYKVVNTLHNFSGARKSPMNVAILSAAASWVWMLQWALEPGQAGMRHYADRHRRCPLSLNSPLNI